MKPQIACVFLLLAIFFAAFFSSKPDDETFLNCLEKHTYDPTISGIIFTPKNSSFLSVLNKYIENSRFINPETPKPVAVLTPFRESHIQTAIYCSKKHALQMRVRSGGHDFEGISYTTHEVPFFVLDMSNFRSISVDSDSRTAWVGTGATLGETYYTIHQTNSSLGFPAGYCPTVNTGGHFGGGGFGPLTREYGLAADNIVDALVIDADGKILNRASMGEDLFWAIRGGVGSNFAVILYYKISLVDVPEKVTVFNVSKTIEEGAVQLAHKWEHIARVLPINLTLSLKLKSIVSPQTGKPTVNVMFISVFRGGVDELLSIMSHYFAELGLTRKDCQEILWIQFFPFYEFQPIDNFEEYLTTRVQPTKRSFKAKSDFVKEPIPEEGLAKIFNSILEVPPSYGLVEWTIFAGGIMDRIPESAIPFPHRKILIFLYQAVYWDPKDNSTVAETCLNWLKNLHNITGAYVPDNPRAAYVDVRDYDLGVNNPVGPTSMEQAKKWGIPYFKNNFDRLVEVKTKVDRGNFFKNEQSFPPLWGHSSI